ncbi:hypothetical protein [Nonomuraea sp. NPDC049480]|uniref:hypothetical protein n=1 Tax=Nonomuraea sp. NPDC049480 TaxID=3364353 RepID=UPI00379A59BA
MCVRARPVSGMRSAAPLTPSPLNTSSVRVHRLVRCRCRPDGRAVLGLKACFAVIETDDEVLVDMTAGRTTLAEAIREHRAQASGDPYILVRLLGLSRIRTPRVTGHSASGIDIKRHNGVFVSLSHRTPEDRGR